MINDDEDEGIRVDAPDDDEESDNEENQLMEWEEGEEDTEEDHWGDGNGTIAS